MRRVPALCYHRIETPPAGAEGDSNFVTPRLFERHLAMLARLGYTGVTVSDWWAARLGTAVLPPRPILITFDDGYESVAEHALPRLDALGWSATLFIVTGSIGAGNAWDPAAPVARILDARSLRTLADRGHEIGAHTRTHRRVTQLRPAEWATELCDARRELGVLLGRPVRSFAFPYGTHDARAVEAVRDAGYDVACTLKRWGNGSRTDPLRLGRMSVGGELPPWALAAKLAKLLLTPSRRAAVRPSAAA